MIRKNRTESTQCPTLLEQFTLGLPRELLEETVMESPYGFVIASVQEAGNSIVFVNRAFEEITGYRASEVSGLSCSFLLDGDDDQESLTELSEAIKSKKKSTKVLRNYRKDGTLFYNELSVYPIFGQTGDVTHLVWAQNDVTSLIKVKERFSAYLQHSNEALWRLDFYPPISMNTSEAEQVQAIIDHGVYGEINDVAAQIYGHREGRAIIGRPLSEFLQVSNSENIKMLTKLVRCKFHMKDLLVKEKTSGGSQLITLNNIKPTINNGNVTHLWGASLDVTEFVKTKEELQRSKDELDSQKESLVQKNAALKELIAHIEFEKKSIADRLASHISDVALPSLEKIRLNKDKEIYIDLHRNILEDLATSHSHKLNNIRKKLTQREMEICDFVKNGHSNKEIAQLLNIATQTVMKHRRMARKKLDLNNTKVNLYTYLNSL